MAYCTRLIGMAKAEKRVVSIQRFLLYFLGDSAAVICKINLNHFLILGVERGFNGDLLIQGLLQGVKGIDDEIDKNPLKVLSNPFDEREIRRNVNEDLREG